MTLPPLTLSTVGTGAPGLDVAVDDDVMLLTIRGHLDGAVGEAVGAATEGRCTRRPDGSTSTYARWCRSPWRGWRRFGRAGCGPLACVRACTTAPGGDRGATPCWRPTRRWGSTTDGRGPG